MDKKSQYTGIAVFVLGTIFIGAAYIYSWRDVVRQISEIEVSPPTDDVGEIRNQFEEIQASFESISDESLNGDMTTDGSEGENEESNQLIKQLSPFEQAILDAEQE